MSTECPEQIGQSIEAERCCKGFRWRGEWEVTANGQEIFGRVVVVKIFWN